MPFPALKAYAFHRSSGHQERIGGHCIFCIIYSLSQMARLSVMASVEVGFTGKSLSLHPNCTAIGDFCER